MFAQQLFAYCVRIFRNLETLGYIVERVIKIKLISEHKVFFQAKIIRGLPF